MRRGTLILLLLILLLAAGAAFVDFWPHSDKGAAWHGVNNPFTVQQGLDLQGGVSILLVPDPSQHYSKQEVDSAIVNTLTQIENRVNALDKKIHALNKPAKEYKIKIMPTTEAISTSRSKKP